MAKSAKSQAHPDLWDTAYQQLKEYDDGKKTLARFDDTLGKEQAAGGNAIGDLESERGRKRLLQLIERKSSYLESLKGTQSRVSSICDVMYKAKEIVAAAASASPPATVAVAGLFVAFELYHTCKEEDRAMFETASEAADILVRAASESEKVVPRVGDNAELLDLRLSLERHYVALYKTVLGIIAKLVDALCSKRKYRALSNMFARYDWAAQLLTLRNVDRTRKADLETMERVPQPIATNNDGRNPLHEAAANGRHDEVSQLLETGRYEIDAPTRARRWTALMLACEQGHLETVKRLIDRKLDINALNDRGRTALHIAAYQNHGEVVNALLSRRPLPAKVNTDDGRGRTPFLDAAERGNTDSVRVLLYHGAGLNGVTRNGWTALHLAAEGDRIETVKYLIYNGADQKVKILKGDKAGRLAKEVAVGQSLTLLR
ncbi:hypothetical protein LTR36_009868 [Oleoguttula mirabilis]|uniref:NWD NACHT-NTPase N-terminal domain-containing protein n=1 Tax=Oleoguttula mirabilis TaxID=1507867 RepID=A0AAV9J525_9PEZI|nr:hypothetical protein LTR36_009868 [Oleoguttula mirabilis]